MTLLIVPQAPASKLASEPPVDPLPVGGRCLHAVVQGGQDPGILCPRQSLNKRLGEKHGGRGRGELDLPKEHRATHSHTHLCGKRLALDGKQLESIGHWQLRAGAVVMLQVWPGIPCGDSKD